MDRRRIFSVLINRADHQQVPSQTSNSQERPRWFYIDGSLDMRWFIEKEWDAEAGNMVVSRTSSRKRPELLEADANSVRQSQIRALRQECFTQYSA